ncbi:TPA: hypothetical protein H1012_00340 [archaeon]|nr:hypothetical protein [Candidatus Naiadarchaeales archaeon SRR2090153.bin461]HIK02279.1 hypothetical protein [Candidatus Naiadarchaeales archaeon SRR2090159.bin1288]
MAKRVTFTKDSILILCDCGYENAISAAATTESILKMEGGIKCEKCGRFIKDEEIDRLGKKSGMKIIKELQEETAKNMKRLLSMPLGEFVKELQRVYPTIKLDYCTFCGEGNFVFEDDNNYKCGKCGKKVWKK